MHNCQPISLSNSEAYIFDTYFTVDKRGSFQKLFNKDWLKELSDFKPAEVFLTLSEPKVLRGFHIQINNGAYEKIVTCVSGSVLDILIDLRAGKDFGKTYSFSLQSEKRKALFIPKGYGHAFLNEGEIDAQMLYIISSQHNPEEDTGVRWDSVDFSWPIKNPIVSDRDNNLPALSSFSPQ